MIVESDTGYRFVISHHFENNVRNAGDRSHPARVKRLAQETVTLSTSLPLSYSSSVFVRCDTDRLDIMKVRTTFFPCFLVTFSNSFRFRFSSPDPLIRHTQMDVLNLMFTSHPIIQRHRWWSIWKRLEEIPFALIQICTTMEKSVYPCWTHGTDDQRKNGMHKRRASYK